MTYRDMLMSDRFYYGVQVVTTPGLPTPNSPADTLTMAKTLLGDGRIGWISVTDHPGGGPMLPPDWPAGCVVSDAPRDDDRRKETCQLTFEGPLLPRQS